LARGCVRARLYGRSWQDILSRLNDLRGLHPPLRPVDRAALEARVEPVLDELFEALEVDESDAA
jgi:hypothetical protein